jgi:hypothetical protein
MTSRRRWTMAAAPLACLLGLGLAGQAGAVVDEPGTQPWEAGASNMGLCSAYLGQTQGRLEPNARAEVNHLIQTLPFGYTSPGELFSVRARQEVSLPPEQECVRRR